MPPRPMNSRISSWGNFAASSAQVGGGGCNPLALDCPGSPGNSVGVATFIAITQRGQRPDRALTGKGTPHCGQFCEVVILIPVTSQSFRVCYRLSFPGQYLGQMAHFCLDIIDPGQGVGYFFPIY